MVHWRSSIVLVLSLAVLVNTKVQSKVQCSEENMTMTVEVTRPDNKSLVYLKGLKFYPDEKCRPVLEDNKATFRLSLSDVFRCGVYKIENTLTGARVFMHSIVVEEPGGDVPKELVNVKCVMASSLNLTALRTRRNVLPAGFQEEEFVEITRSVEEKAPEPKLSVGVSQGGQEVTGELNVNPGTPLEMRIFLNKESAPVYGLLVSYMQVTDTKAQEETIIFNGCSVDPYLFENFNTVDGDSLTAKFRAFKFPESTYVQFKGTVSVCLDKCRGVQCSNGQMGYGRRRREVNAMPADPNKVFEVSMSTFIKVDYKEGDEQALIEKDLLDLIRPRNNGTRVTAQESNSLPESEGTSQQNLNFRTERIQEQFHYTIIDERNPASAVSPVWLLVTVMVVLVSRANAS